MKTSINENLSLGAVCTPPDLVSFMVELAAPPAGLKVNVLEPACGDAPFLKEFFKRYGSNHNLFGLDIFKESTKIAKNQANFAEIIEADFLLWKPYFLFDIIIGNPPYGIIGDSSHYPIYPLLFRKSEYKNIFQTWYGKFNIYAAFIERAVYLLKPNGKLVFVVPASWLILKEYTYLRKFLSINGLLRIYYLGKVFPKRNISVVVFVLERGKQGLELYDGTNLIVKKTSYQGELIRFESPEALDFERNGIPLGDFFNIYFAARSTQVRSNPFVISSETLQGKNKSNYVPILTGRNLHKGWIDYNNCYSGFFMPLEKAYTLRKFYSFPHIVVGHTKGTKVIAAFDERCYPWREEFHLVPKKNITFEEIRKIINYLISDPVQKYIYKLYRDMVPHLTKIMLERIPLPEIIFRKNKLHKGDKLWYQSGTF
ncbi:MAG: TaqI-like C-terminal specificity domain-containing protein [Thermoplasmata archaeon]